MSIKPIKAVAILLAGAIILIGSNRLGIRALNQGFFAHVHAQSGVLDHYFRSGSGPYEMLVGDLNCLNPEGAGLVVSAALEQSSAYPGSMLFVPGLCRYTEEFDEQVEIIDFSLRIGNSRGVVVVDNFCTKNWSDLREKPLYDGSGLSPGPFCKSEEETRFMDEIIRRFRVKKVILLYNVESYRHFSQNFLDYLEERDIIYEFRKNDEI